MYGLIIQEFLLFAEQDLIKIFLLYNVYLFIIVVVYFKLILGNVSL